MIDYTLITDGAYSFTRNQGGIGLIVIDNEGYEVLEYNKTYVNTTNNQMEMMACILGMEAIKEPSVINIITDSQYVIGCATKGWKRKKNVELWKRFDKAMNFHKEVTFTWTKGHADDKYNIRCDKLAVEASQKEIPKKNNI